MNQHHWQDARLKKALEHAPDCNLKPSSQVRDRILHAAAQATKPPALESHRTSWTQTLAQIFAPKSRTPWNAAWGTALVVVCVGLVWSYHTLELAPEAGHETPTVEYSRLDSAPALPQSAPTMPPERVSIPSDEAASSLNQPPPPPLTPMAEPVPEPASVPPRSSITATDPQLKPERPAVPSTARSAQTQPSATTEVAEPQARPSAPVASPAPQTRPAAPAASRLPEAPSETTFTINTPSQPPEIAVGQSVESSPTRAREQASSQPPMISSDTENDYLSASRGQVHAGADGARTGNLAISAEQDKSLTTVGLATAQEESSPHADAMFATQTVSLPEALSFALQQWRSLQVTTSNQNYLLERGKATPLPEILPRITSTYNTTPYALLQLRHDAWTLVFYNQDNTKLGMLIIQDSSWYFYSPHQASSMLTGYLSASQKPQLEEVLKSLVLR